MVKYRTGKIKSHLSWFSPLPWGVFIPAGVAPTPQSLDSSLSVGGRGGAGTVGANQQPRAAGKTGVTLL